MSILPYSHCFLLTQRVGAPAQRWYFKGLGEWGQGEETRRTISAGWEPSCPEYKGTNKMVRPQWMPMAAIEEKGQPEQCIVGTDLTCLPCPGSLKDYTYESQVLFKASIDSLCSSSSKLSSWVTGTWRLSQVQTTTKSLRLCKVKWSLDF